jgi:tetratricopeptide (TPR) repeat protein
MKLAFLIAISLLAHIPAFSFTSVDSVAHYISAAQRFSQERKFSDADKNFRKAIAFNSGNEAASILYANFLLEQKKYFVALEQYKKVLTINNTQPEALQRATNLCFVLRRWKDLIVYANTMLQNNIGDSVRVMLATAYYEEEEYLLSKDVLTHAVAANPSNLEALNLLGKVLIELSEYKQAITVYDKAMQLDPDNYNLIYEYGLLYYSINKDKDAVKYFELAAEKGYKTDLNYKENLGLAYLSFDRDKALEILNQVLVKKPNNPEIMFQVAHAFYKDKSFQIAADRFYNIYKIDETNSKALYMTGIAYQKMGDKSKGTEFCSKAIKMDPALAELKSISFGGKVVHF